MANKTGMGYSPLTGRIYWGLQNVDTGVWVGNKKKDITNDFLQVMEHKFPVNTKQNISVNGEHHSTIYNIAADREVLVLNAAKPGDTDSEKYKALIKLVGDQGYEDHGCCDSCYYEAVSEESPCECERLKNRQTMIMALSKKSVNE